MSTDSLEPSVAVERFAQQLNEEIAAKVKLLLEEKHLYQTVTIEPEEILAPLIKRVLGQTHPESVKHKVDKILAGSFLLATGPVRNSISTPSAGRVCYGGNKPCHRPLRKSERWDVASNVKFPGTNASANA